MERIKRSWRLTKQSYALLMKDKELMLLPLFSMLACGVLLAGLVLGMGFGEEGTTIQKDDPKVILAGFLFYVATFTVGIFFQCAVVAGAMERLRGGDPTIGSAIGAALKRLPAILMWGLIGGTIGMVIRSLQERSEWVGKIVFGIVGVVWTLAIFFMAPVLVMEKKGTFGSLKHSWGLFKKTWGETVSGSIGFGLIGFLLVVPTVIVAALIVQAGAVWPGIILGALGVVAITMFLTALQGVWVASLYRYATEGEVPAGFDADLIASAFAPKS